MSKQYLTLLLTLFTSPLFAHNVWLEQNHQTTESNDYIVKFGHIETESYPENKLTQVDVLDTQGNKIIANAEFKHGEMHLVLPQTTAMVLLGFDNGVWSKLPSGKYVEKDKQQAPDAESSINPLKAGKAILDWHAPTALVAHQQKYELIPQAIAKAGQPLAILVLVDGKPAEKIKVGLGEDQPFVETNAQGIASFTPTKGFNKVWAEFEEPVADTSRYDSRSIEYLLTFDAE